VDGSSRLLQQISSAEYKFIEGQFTYYDAQKICLEKYGTNLATIRNDADATKLLNGYKASGINGNMWIGLNDLNIEDVWKYDSGYDCGGNCKSQKYWITGEPNSAGHEDCVEIWPSANSIDNMLNDGNCNDPANVIRGAICDPPNHSGEVTLNGITCPDGEPYITLNEELYECELFIRRYHYYSCNEDGKLVRKTYTTPDCTGDYEIDFIYETSTTWFCPHNGFIYYSDDCL
jgi:hypothetical protein